MRWAENAGYKKAFTVFCEGFLCPEPDSNQHTLRHMYLKHACLPFHHRGLRVQIYAFFFSSNKFFCVADQKNICRSCGEGLPVRIFEPNDGVFRIFSKKIWRDEKNPYICPALDEDNEIRYPASCPPLHRLKPGRRKVMLYPNTTSTLQPAGFRGGFFRSRPPGERPEKS